MIQNCHNAAHIQIRSRGVAQKSGNMSFDQVVLAQCAAQAVDARYVAAYHVS